MRKPLNKRLKRELKSDIGKYICLFLFLTLTIGFVSGFLVAGDSMKSAYDESFDKYSIEDGHFTLASEAPDTLLSALRDQNVLVYPLFYKNFELPNAHTVRIYKTREDVNRICLMSGAEPQTDEEIVIDRLYAENNALSVGDAIKIEDKDFTICGVVAFSDYSALFKNNTDMMFDANKFTVACVTENAFDGLSANSLQYNYAWRYLDDMLIEKADRILELVAGTGLAVDFVKQDDNQAIVFTGDDMGSDYVMMVTLLYIVMAVLAFVFGITTRNTIEKEAGTIGTLRASGYTKGELIRHYMILPIAVTLLAAVVGNVLGYTVFKEIVAGVYYHSYSLPTYVTLWNTDAFIMTTLIPCLIVFVVIFVVLWTALSLRPLQFLRRELTRKKKKRVIKLRRFTFLSRFRLRVIFQNIPAYVTLFFGVVFASILLMFGMMMPPMLSSFKTEIIGSKIAEYQYILKAPIQTEDSSAEKYSVCALQNENGEEITVYGIDSDSRYLNADLSDGRILLSDGYMDKYGIKAADTLTLSEKYKDVCYHITVDGSYHYPATMSVFMSRQTFSEIFGLDEESFSGYFSNCKLSDIDEKYIATVITESDLTVMADQLDDSMGNMFVLMCGFSVILYLLLIYLLAKQVLEKNIQSISMIKILGYTDAEISGLYSVPTGTVMVLSLLLSLPISYFLIKIIYYIMMLDYNGWLTFYIAPWIYPVMVGIGAACYAVVYRIQMRHIRRIPMGSALKNVE